MHPEKILERNIPLSTRGVVIDGVHASAWLTENQQISLMGLLPLPTLGPGAPRIVIRNVRLNLWSGVASRRPVTAQLDEVLVTKHQQADGSAKQMIVLRGSADFADEVLVSRADMVGKELDLRCSIKGAHLSRDLFDRLPSQWFARIRHVQDLQCECEATLAVRRSSDGAPQLSAPHHGSRRAIRSPDASQANRGATWRAGVQSARHHD